MNKIRVTHVLPGLDVGGAEFMLLRLLRDLDRSTFENRVISMTGKGVLGPRIEAMGIEVRSMGMGRMPGPAALARLASQLRQDDPDVVQTWLYAADLVGGLAARSVGIRNVVWNLRQSAPRPQTSPRRHHWTAKACARASRNVPEVIISCSEEAGRSHRDLGYDGEIVVIPNGFDLTSYRPDAEAAASVRAELNLDSTTPLVGMVARFDAIKGHDDFFEAALLVARSKPNAHFLLCGKDVTTTNRHLSRWVGRPILCDRTHLVGRRGDVPRLLTALDVFVSASHSEGFPNAVGEAMATAVPCVVTDVGDSAVVVGKTGRVVPAHSHLELADAVLALLSLSDGERLALGASARRRIETNFAIPSVVERYASVYENLARGGQLHDTPLVST